MLWCQIWIVSLRTLSVICVTLQNQHQFWPRDMVEIENEEAIFEPLVRPLALRRMVIWSRRKDAEISSKKSRWAHDSSRTSKILSKSQIQTGFLPTVLQLPRFSSYLQLFGGYSDVVPEMSILKANDSAETLLCGLVHHSEPSGSAFCPSRRAMFKNQFVSKLRVVTQKN